MQDITDKLNLYYTCRDKSKQVLRYSDNNFIQEQERLDSHLFSCVRFVNIFGGDIQKDYPDVPNLKLKLYDILLQHDDEEIYMGLDIPIHNDIRPTRLEEIKSVCNLYNELLPLYIQNYVDYEETLEGKIAKDIDILVGTLYVLTQPNIDKAPYSLAHCLKYFNNVNKRHSYDTTLKEITAYLINICDTKLGKITQNLAIKLLEECTQYSTLSVEEQQELYSSWLHNN
jgi:hypothetical protein